MCRLVVWETSTGLRSFPPLDRAAHARPVRLGDRLVGQHPVDLAHRLEHGVEVGDAPLAAMIAEKAFNINAHYAADKGKGKRKRGADKTTFKQERLEADLIMMGSHGHSAIYRLLVGSVTEGVMRKAPCPIMIVPSPRK